MRGELKKGPRIAWLLLLIWIGPIPANGAVAPAPLRVSYPAPTASQLPLWVAKEWKFFDKHGVGVELVYVGSSSIAIAALLAGIWTSSPAAGSAASPLTCRAIATWRSSPA